MIEELGWILAFTVVFIVTHYQFKYCVPITLWTLKFLQTCMIILVCKLYVAFRVYGTLDFSQINAFVLNVTSMYTDL